MKDNFSNKIFFGDEADFTLGGYVNKQNCQNLSENPYLIEESPLHPEKFNVWFTLSPKCMMGPYFFENDEETTITVNSKRYGHMISDFFVCYRRIRLGGYVV